MRPGLTLLEVMVAGSIMVIVLSISLPFLVTVHRAWQDNEDRSTLMDGARATAAFVGLGVRQARRFGNVPSAADPAGSLTVELLAADGDYHEHTYYFDTTGTPPGLGWVRLLDTNLVNGDASDARLAGPVQSLSFDMRKEDGITVASHPWEACLVRVSAMGATGEGESTFPVVASILKRRSPALCALFCGGNLHLRGSTRVTGDVYSGGDLVLDSGARVRGGVAYAASSVVGNGAAVGSSPTPAPTLPLVDQSHYDALLATAQTEPNADVDWSTGQMLLGGGTINVHGQLQLRNDAAVVGPGTLVVTGGVTARDDAQITGGARVVCGRRARLRQDAQITGGGLLYAGDGVQLEDGVSVEADVVTPGDVSIDSRTAVSGIVYAGGQGRVEGTVSGATYMGSEDWIHQAAFVAEPGVIGHAIPGLNLRY